MKHRKYIIVLILIPIILLCAVGYALWATSSSNAPPQESDGITSKPIYVSKDYIELRTDEASKKSIEPLEMSIYGLNYSDNQLKNIMSVKFKIADVVDCKKYALNNFLRVSVNFDLTSPENKKLFRDEDDFSIFTKSDSPLISELEDTDIINSTLKVKFKLDLSDESMIDDEFTIIFDMRIGSYETYTEWRNTFLEEDDETIKGNNVFTFNINY